MPDNGGHESDISAELRRIEDKITALRSSGNLDGAITLLHERVREVAHDHARTRRRAKRERQEYERKLAEAGKVPEGKVVVDQAAWDAANAAQQALATLGVDAATIATEFPKGQAAIVALGTSEVAQAMRLSATGAKALRQLVTDHKLPVKVKTVKVGDKDEAQGFVVHEGKDVPLREYLETHHEAYAPAVFAAGEGAPARTTKQPDGTRRMPATGSTNVPAHTGSTGTAPAVREQAAALVQSMRRRYVPDTTTA